MQFDEVIIFVVFVNIILLVFIAGIVMFIFHYRRRKLADEKEKLLVIEKHQQEILQSQLEIQTQTMQEIGREIHDNVGQKLVLASLYTQQLDFDNEYPQIHDRINNVSSIINESLKELRALSKNLTNYSIEEKTLKELLEEEAAKVMNASQYIVTTNIDGANGYSTLIKTIVLRIVQEFFQNTMKHADGEKINLTLKRDNNGLSLTVDDDGKGFDMSDKKEGIGLQNIRKRASLVGGHLQISSAPGECTSLYLLIPDEKL